MDLSKVDELLEKYNTEGAETGRMTKTIPMKKRKNMDEDDEEAEGGGGGGMSMAPSLPNQLTTETEWARQGTSFAPTTRADKSSKLPGGVYRFVQTREGWYLDRIGNNFEFPFKVYDASLPVIKRIHKFWSVNGGNLGVLLNGLRGAGKTMTAQLLANDLIEEMNVPVLIVRNPIPLQLVFDNVQQHMVVIFDEFEKTHNEQMRPGAQQELLSTIDGMSRSSYNRLILFTTNTRNINENFKDRPSRIHYKFEFNRVADEIIEGLIDDCLPKALIHLKPDIFQFLNSREICTIDIVKACIAEVVTFKESPLEFEDMLNIAKGVPPSFTVSIVNAETNVLIKKIDSYFRLDRHYSSQATLMSGNKRAITDFQESRSRHNNVTVCSTGWNGSVMLNLLEVAKDKNGNVEEGYWLANVSIPSRKTFWNKYPFLEMDDSSLYLNDMPKDWEPLPSPAKAKENEKLQEKVEEAFNNAECYATLYGEGEKSVLKILIEANTDTFVDAPSRYKVGGAPQSIWGD